MVPPSLSEDEAASAFPTGVYTKDLPSGRKYLRYTNLSKPMGDCTDIELSLLD